MNGVGYFFWLAEQSIQAGLVLMPFFTLLAFLALVIAVVAHVNRPEAMQRKWRWILIPFLIPIAILIYGVVFRYTGTGHSPDTTKRVLVLQILLWSHIPIAIILMFIVKRNPLVPLGLSFFQFWLSLSTSALAGMSVTGNWL